MNLFTALLSIVLSFYLASCGFPGNKLTTEERKSDMTWAFDIFEHNYAPKELKLDVHGVDLEVVKADCMAKAAEEMTNQEFMSLFQLCVHKFKDAHVSTSQMNNGILPEMAIMAHLGFVTQRARIEVQGLMFEAQRVAGILPGNISPAFPILVGDMIIKADGKEVAQVVKDEIVPYVNLGQPESDLTVSSMKFSVRSSMELPLPSNEDIVLTVLRGEDSFEVTLPWIQEDLLTFMEKQKAANPENGDELAPGEIEIPKDIPLPGLVNPLAYSFFGYDIMSIIFKKLDSPLETMGRRAMEILENSFRFAQFSPVLSAIMDGSVDAGLSEIMKTRTLPETDSIIPVLPDQTIPAFIVTVVTGEVFAYIQLAQFAGDDVVVDEFNKILAQINQTADVQGLILDLIDNGGGSLIHGMRMVNSLRDKKLNFPSIQVQTNNNWMNSFRSQAAFGVTLTEKTMAQRILKKLEVDKDAGLDLSRPISVEALDSLVLNQPNLDCETSGKCLKKGMKLAVLVNELCVSMCDIFSDSVQDNDLGLIIGQRTMGGGGNVAGHGLSPISKMMINLTESLMVSASGKKYLENNGVEPDLEIDMVLDRVSGFAKTLDMAFKYITGQLSPVPVPEPAS